MASIMNMLRSSLMDRRVSRVNWYSSTAYIFQVFRQLNSNVMYLQLVLHRSAPRTLRLPCDSYVVPSACAVALYRIARTISRLFVLSFVSHVSLYFCYYLSIYNYILAEKYHIINIERWAGGIYTYATVAPIYQLAVSFVNSFMVVLHCLVGIVWVAF